MVDAHVAARIEYAIYSATAYATAWKICKCIEPLVIPRSTDGGESYKSIIIAAKGGPNGVGDLANAKLAGLSQSSFAGHKFAVFQLQSNGFKLPQKIEFAQTGEDAVQRFLAGEYTALIGWSSMSGDPVQGYSLGTLKLIAAANGGKSLPYRVIWQSSPIPHRPHVIRKSIAAEAKRLLRDVLTRMYDADPIAYDSIETIFGGGFVAARHGQFLPIIEYVNSLAPSKQKPFKQTVVPPKPQPH